MGHRVGNMINGDYRRIINADATGMHANNFTTFSAGPGACGFVKMWYYLHNHPWELEQAIEKGMLKVIPVHKLSNTQPDQTVYMTNVQYAMAAGTFIGSYMPKMYRWFPDDDLWKHFCISTMHPPDKYLEYCQKDWDRYQEMFKEHNGCKDQAFIPYPYTKEMLLTWFDWYNRDVQSSIQISWEGVGEDVKERLLEADRQKVRGMRKELIPLLILDSKLYKEKGHKKVDPYYIASVPLQYTLRQKYMGSRPTSAKDFDQESYLEWGKTIGDGYRCEFVAVDQKSNQMFGSFPLWVPLFGAMDAKSSHHNLPA